MTVDKEAILKDHGIICTGQDYAKYGTRYSDILNAMDEYAASLLKENEELRQLSERLKIERDKFEGGDNLKSKKIELLESELRPLINAHQKNYDQLTAFQSSNEAKDREIAELKEAYEIMRDKSERMDAAEKLIKCYEDFDYEGYVKTMSEYSAWQKLKQKLP